MAECLDSPVTMEAFLGALAQLVSLLHRESFLHKGALAVRGALSAPSHVQRPVSLPLPQPFLLLGQVS